MGLIPHIRWMLRRDLKEVLQIEQGSFPRPWTEEMFKEELKRRSVIGMVAEWDDGLIVGYMIYELHSDRMELINLAVDPVVRRMGAGRAMIDKLVGKLSTQRRRKIVANVCERNLGAQLFFAKCGFEAVSIVRQPYEDDPQDAYRFVRWHKQGARETEPLVLVGD